MKRTFICILLIIALSMSLVLPAAAAGEVYVSWQDAYFPIIKSELDSMGNYFVLVDLDLDGSPELLSGSVPGSGGFSSASKAYTSKKGVTQQLRHYESEYMISLQDYELWYNTATGEPRINTTLSMRSGYSYYTTGVVEVSCVLGFLTNSYVLSKEITVDMNGVSTETYFTDNGIIISEAQYNTQMDEYFGGSWKKIDNFPQATLMKSFAKASDAEIREFLNSFGDGMVSGMPSRHKLTVDGVAVDVRGYNINGNNFFKLRDVAMALNGSEAQFEVAWDGALRSISLATGKSYTPVGGEMAAIAAINQLGIRCRDALYVDGADTSLLAYNINGNNYFKIRDLASALGFEVEWDAATSTMNIISDPVKLTPDDITLDGCWMYEDSINMLTVDIVDHAERSFKADIHSSQKHGTRELLYSGLNFTSTDGVTYVSDVFTDSYNWKWQVSIEVEVTPERRVILHGSCAQIASDPYIQPNYALSDFDAERYF